MHSLPRCRVSPLVPAVQGGFPYLGMKTLNAEALAARWSVAPLRPGGLGLEPWRCPGSPELPSLAVESSDSVLGCTLSVRMAVPGVLTHTLRPVLEFRLHPQPGGGACDCLFHIPIEIVPAGSPWPCGCGGSQVPTDSVASAALTWAWQ